MSYIGSPPASQAFAPGTDTFSGTGSQTAFTLSRNVATVNDILVVVNNVEQQPSHYSVSTSTLTFSTAPSSGTNNIYVRYLSTNLITIAPQQGSVTNKALDVGNSDGTGAMLLPTGTTAQRPSIPLNGMYRMNSTTGYPEYYDGTTWYQVNQTKTYTVSYLIVAGGGAGGGNNSGGGGGAGGLLSSTATLTNGITYSVVIGAGGTGTASATSGGSGSNSTALSLTAIGGGGGGVNELSGSPKAGVSGGSGGGGSYQSGAGGSGTSGQGFAGGVGSTSVGASGGGGGSSAIGSSATASLSGAGGAGTASSITGSSVTYAGGGGGGTNYSATVASGGSGGGGNGGTNAQNATAGTVNTGSGGGGAGLSPQTSANGGSGVVIISVPITNYTGTITGSPTVTTSGSNIVLKFTASGSYTA